MSAASVILSCPFCRDRSFVLPADSYLQKANCVVRAIYCFMFHVERNISAYNTLKCLTQSIDVEKQSYVTHRIYCIHQTIQPALK